MNEIISVAGGVCAAAGFQATGVAAGIKKAGKDMAMLFCEVPCAVAGTFTSNIVKAAPVLWDMHIVEELKKAQVCVMNSGVANACTGEEGMRICAETAKAAAAAFAEAGIPVNEEMVLTASTGVIGRQVPIDKIEAGIGTMVPVLDGTDKGGDLAAQAIMTTDTVPKQAAVSFMLDGKKVTVGGMSKGSGMIHPNMCTMLAFITTDAAIDQALLQKALSDSVKDSYNMISVDGDTSTNDTCLLLASGLAGNEPIVSEDKRYELFKSALDQVNKALARKMAADGEGASALIEMKVIGASSVEEAKIIAKSVIGSSLVKTAVAGHDANWGRILCAMGYSGAQFDPQKVDLYFDSAAGSLKIIENGVDTGYSEDKATAILSQKEILITADLKQGECEATAWGCDLTHAYISINADYRS